MTRTQQNNTIKPFLQHQEANQPFQCCSFTVSLSTAQPNHRLNSERIYAHHLHKITFHSDTLWFFIRAFTYIQPSSWPQRRSSLRRWWGRCCRIQWLSGWSWWNTKKWCRGSPCRAPLPIARSRWRCSGTVIRCWWPAGRASCPSWWCWWPHQWPHSPQCCTCQSRRGANQFRGTITVESEEEELHQKKNLPDAGQPVRHQSKHTDQQDQNCCPVLQVVVQLPRHPTQTQQPDHLQGAEQTADALEGQRRRWEEVLMVRLGSEFSSFWVRQDRFLCSSQNCMQNPELHDLVVSWIRYCGSSLNFTLWLTGTYKKNNLCGKLQPKSFWINLNKAQLWKCQLLRLFITMSLCLCSCWKPAGATWSCSGISVMEMEKQINN